MGESARRVIGDLLVAVELRRFSVAFLSEYEFAQIIFLLCCFSQRLVDDAQRFAQKPDARS